MKYILGICIICILSIGFIGYAAFINLNGDLVFAYPNVNTQESVGITFGGSRAGEPAFSFFYSHLNNTNSNNIGIGLSLLWSKREWLTSYSLNSNMRFSLGDNQNMSGAFELNGDYLHTPLYANYELGVWGKDMLPSITNYPLSYFDVDKFRISASGNVKMLLGKVGKIYGDGTFYYVYPRYRMNFNVSVPNPLDFPLLISAGKEFFDNYDIGIGNRWENIHGNTRSENSFSAEYFDRQVFSFGIRDELRVKQVGIGEYIINSIIGYGVDEKVFYSVMGYGKMDLGAVSLRGGFKWEEEKEPIVYAGISLKFE